MFELIERNSAAGARRVNTVVLSVVLHVVIIGAFIIVPLLYVTSDLPSPPDVIRAFAAAPPAAPPPPPPPGAAPPQPAATTGQQDLVPVAAPNEINLNPPPPSPSNTVGEVVPGGVVGGIAGGVPGGTVGGIPDAAPVSAQAPVRIGGQIKAPNLRAQVDPVYPPVARAAHASGVVMLEATVDTSGRVQNVRVLRGVPLLNQAAIDAVRQWRYSPLMLNGQATPFILTVTVTFRLQ